MVGMHLRNVPMKVVMGYLVLLMIAPLATVKGVDISVARASAGSGDPVTVQGIVTTVELGSILYIQDGTGGIGVYASVGDSPQRGDLVEVTGTVIEYNNLAEFSGSPTLTIISSGNPLPEPVLLTIAELVNNGEAYEGELVRVENVLPVGGGTFSGETNYDFTAPDNWEEFFYVRIDRDTDIPGSPIPSSEVNITGILGQYRENYQLFPRSREDIRLVGGDYDAPTVLDIDPIDATHVEIEFSEDLDPASAANADNYWIDPGVTVQSARLVPGATDRVELTTSAMPSGVLLDLTVDGVEDLAGNMSWDFVSFMAGVLSISRAELSEDGDFIPDLVGSGLKVSVEGIVTSPNYQVGNRIECYIQDGTGGITLYSGAFTVGLQMGDRVRVKGIIDSFRGKEEITPASASDIVVLGTGEQVPEPLEISLAALMALSEADREALDGTLLKVVEAAIDPLANWPAEGSAANLEIYDPVDPLNLYLTLRIDDQTDIDGQEYPQDVEAIVGVFSQYDAFNCTPCNAGYQLLPRAYSDFLNGAVSVASPEITGFEPVPSGMGTAVLITYSSTTDGLANLEVAESVNGPWEVLVGNIPMQAGWEGQYQAETSSSQRYYRLVAVQ